LQNKQKQQLFDSQMSNLPEGAFEYLSEVKDKFLLYVVTTYKRVNTTSNIINVTAAKKKVQA
jgi:hypothetical protein